MVLLAPLVPSVMMLKRFGTATAIMNLEQELNSELRELRALKRATPPRSGNL